MQSILFSIRYLLVYLSIPRHLKYLSYVLRHKYYVLVFGIYFRVPFLQIILHDWHKFLPSEWFPYARMFYKSNGESQYEESSSSNYAWNAHQKRAKHHWQYWILQEDSGTTKLLEMPERFVREMLADWYSAGYVTSKPDVLFWYSQNRNKMSLHTTTRKLVEELLSTIIPKT